MKKLYINLSTAYTVIFWCVMILQSGLQTVKAQDLVTVFPEEHTEAFSNPLKGFRPDDGDWNKYQYPTLVRDYIAWNEIENSEEDGVQKIVDFCNSKWNRFPAANIKVIPRVYIDWDNNKGNEYWPADLENGDWRSKEFKDRVVKLIYKLGEAWDNDPRVAWVQTGIIGYWGEQENPVGVDQDGWVERMGEAFLAAFPNKLLVVRNQNYWDAKGYEFGVYWDSFAHPGQRSGSWTRIQNANAKGRYLIQPVEGEVAYNWGEDKMGPFIGTHPDMTLSTEEYRNNLIDVMRELHCSALGWVASYSTGKTSVAEGAAFVQKEFGYRFIVPEFSCSRRVEPGGRFDLSFEVKNVGAAPFYENWPLAFVLIDESTRRTVWTAPLTGTDIRTWHPGGDYDYDSRVYTTPAEEYEINASVTLPDNIESGQYLAGLTILEPYSRTPGVFFAVKNFLSESQSQPFCRIGVGEDAVGGHEIDAALFDDILIDDKRFYTMEWNGPTHTLNTSAAQGGLVRPAAGDYPENRFVNLSAEAELGYVFSGWSGDLSGSGNPASILIDSDKNVTANFTSVPTYTLSVNAENGTVVLDPSGGVYNEGTVVTLTVTPDLGYIFSGWSGDFSGADNPASITMDADKNISANFDSVPIYTLTTNASNGSISLNPEGPDYTEGTVVEVQAIADRGYIFSGWSGDDMKYPSRINHNYITMDGDKTITAEFTVDPESLGLIKNGDFSQGLDHWTPMSVGPAEATHSVVDGECYIAINEVSDQQWHVNLMQQGIELESNEDYTLTFYARAESDKTITAHVQFDHDPWTTSFTEEINITSSMERYRVAWTQATETTTYKIGFFFGNDISDVWVDNVRLDYTSFVEQIENIENQLPQETLLLQNYPNPFNPETAIPYQLSASSHVKITIHNFLGQQVITLVDEEQTAGYHVVSWNGKSADGKTLATGLYIYRLKTDGHSIQTKKFLLAK